MAEDLTKRQAQVKAAEEAGLDVQETAALLGIEPRTVRDHRNTIKNKEAGRRK